MRHHHCDEVSVGELGEVAVRAEGDPVSFLEYWKNPEATRKKIIGGWCRTGDLAKRDADGDFWYQGRADDMFKSAGYRIGPSEIENCLVKHPAVANCAVVGSPDPERTHIVKAFIVLTAGYEPSAARIRTCSPSRSTRRAGRPWCGATRRVMRRQRRRCRGSSRPRWCGWGSRR